MSSSINLANADLDKLNDQDKAELRQFLANEQQRSQIQARMSLCPYLLAYPPAQARKVYNRLC